MLKDKRVDKMSAAKGITQGKMFYSPISMWFTTAALFIGSLAMCGLIFGILFNKELLLLFLLYLALSFLVTSKLSHSFVITDETLIVINPNYPFRRWVVFQKKEIKKVVINHSHHGWYYLFLVMEQNYVIIETQDTTEKYYCVGLLEDTFDENYTEKTLDDLGDALLADKIDTEVIV